MSLNVIALISGGKDSFFSLLHCIHHGHRVVALANLFPEEAGTHPAHQVLEHHDGKSHGTLFVDPDAAAPGLDATSQAPGEPSDRDLNSFMYQTVGHEVLPLYAAATGLPLYRQPIRGRAVRHERDYDCTSPEGQSGDGNGNGNSMDDDDDETESMLPLLQTILRRHPEANALCAGAILSTYQRTRVESIALRLGLTPLAFLWQYPVLPPPAVADEAPLLLDMAAAGLEARIIKVASAGLDETFLWERVSSREGARRVRSALRRFGASGGAASLGEGGEFETLVVDGPDHLFKRRICVPEDGRTVVREGGGCAWLMLRGARLEAKADGEGAVGSGPVRTPGLLDPGFQVILDSLPEAALAQQEPKGFGTGAKGSNLLSGMLVASNTEGDVLRWSVLADPSTGQRTIQEETIQVVEKVRRLLSEASVDASHITTTIIILRDMSDFPKVNAEYGKLFPKPNPPSRVTISCGDLLPTGCNIAVYLTTPSPQVKADRDGLHVQSRSYWAPANIGPYSQAIDVPVTANQQQTGFRSVAIAGQIPLIPATMVLPTASDGPPELQMVLSLQHLWRVALEVKVQYWTSAVAYFPRSTPEEMERNSKIAGTCWKQAFGSPDDEDESATAGPDPWDLKYNPEYMSLAKNDEAETTRKLPNWSILTLRQQNEPESCIPPVFAAEVEELPRQSAVEWHAHNGLSMVEESSVELTFFPEVGGPGMKVWNTTVKGANATVVYTTVATGRDRLEGSKRLTNLEADMMTACQNSLKKLAPGVDGAGLQRPHLIYVDTTEIESAWQGVLSSSNSPAIVPCHSIWSAYGERQTAVALFETTFHP